MVVLPLDVDGNSGRGRGGRTGGFIGKRAAADWAIAVVNGPVEEAKTSLGGLAQVEGVAATESRAVGDAASEGFKTEGAHAVKDGASINCALASLERPKKGLNEFIGRG